MPRAGGLAVVTQSGALGNALLQNCNDLGIGLRCWISVGNEADLGALDFVRHLLDDEGTTTIALFLEGLKQGDQLLSLGREARARGKSIVVLRAGQSDVGRQASISHTGKLAGIITGSVILVAAVAGTIAAIVGGVVARRRRRHRVQYAMHQLFRN